METEKVNKFSILEINGIENVRVVVVPIIVH